ncbi:MAG TPA: hypothetical protein VKE22_30375 [Haliangiales bacterium]|nr:hypothetical protein [Haliangiales bacterium]
MKDPPAPTDPGSPEVLTLPDGGTGALAAGEEVGRYHVVGPLGAGGMGEVYRATDPRLGRDAAIKVVRPGGHDPRAHQRLLGEAQAMAKVAHPNVVARAPDAREPLIEAAEVELARGRSAAALAYVDRLAAVRGADPIDGAEIDFLRARALDAAGRDRAEAVRLARAALAALADGGEPARDLAARPRVAGAKVTVTGSAAAPGPAR